MAIQQASTRIRCPQFLQAYWQESRRPLASLAFVLPLLALYEVGVVVLGTRAVRNGADVWLRQFLDLLGLSQYFLLPALTVALLLAWHHVANDRWRVSVGVLYTMFAESAMLGLLLLTVGRCEVAAVKMLGGAPFVASDSAAALGSLTAGGALWGRLFGFVGAGVYEEMLFRLLLLPPVSACVARISARRTLGIAFGVALTSLAFAAAHYVGAHGQEFDAFSFAFRFTAGAFFALIFVFRGFGIAAGTHAMYDIFVGFA